MNQKGTTMGIPAYLKRLDPDQQQMAMTIHGPVRAVAGPGSGKTTTYTHRIVHMLASGVPVTNILATTFTNKAAREMKERMAMLVDRYNLAVDLRLLTMGTMHSIAVKICRQYGECLGMEPNFTILDSDDSDNLIDKLIKEVCGKEVKIPEKDVASAISFARNARAPLALGLEKKCLAYRNLWGQFHTVADLYRERKATMNVVDFDDLLEKWLEILETNQTVREQLQQRWTHVMVDEYQDTNLLQDSIIFQLCGKSRNLFVVGDDKQSIYAFRAANVDNILSFDERWPDAKTFYINSNYRSTPQIIGACNSLIRHNPRQLHQDVTTPNADGMKPIVYYPVTDREQDQHIVNSIRMFHRDKDVPYKEMMVLFRGGRQSVLLERDLLAARIPFFKKGQNFWKSGHMKLAMAWLRVLANPLDKMSLSRILGVYPKLGPKAVETALAGINTNDEFRLFAQGHFTPGKAESWPIVQGHLREVFEIYWAGANHGKPLEEAVGKVLEILVPLTEAEWGPTPKDAPEVRSAKQQNVYDRCEDYEVLPQMVAEAKFETLDDLLEAIALQEDHSNDDQKDRVLLSTIHGVKGLEAKITFIMGLNKDVFPSKYCISEEEVQEERRLMFVAMSRAKQILMMYSPRNQAGGGGKQPGPLLPSRFINEIGKDFVTERNV